MANSRIIYEANIFLAGTSDVLIGYVLVNNLALGLQINSVANTAPAEGVANTNMPIRVSGTRKFGITARHIVLSRLVGSGTDEARIFRRIPVFDPGIFAGYVSDLVTEISYEGLTDWSLAGAQNERYRLYASA